MEQNSDKTPNPEVDRVLDANTQTEFTGWRPEPGQLILLPARLPSTHGTLVLPESYTKKNNSGICIKVGLQIESDARFLGLELFFPAHAEFQILDSDTGFLLYVVPMSSIIMTRIPPPEIARVSREKGSGLELNPPTLEHSLRE